MRNPQAWIWLIAPLVVPYCVYSQTGSLSQNLGDYAAGQVIVQFKKGNSPQDKLFATDLNRRFGPFSSHKKFERLLSSEQLQKKFPKRSARRPINKKPVDLSNIHLLRFARKNIDAHAVLPEVRNRPEVEYAELNYLVYANALPNDPFFSSSSSWGQPFDDLWGIKKISADQVWDQTEGSNVIVAIVDSGIDLGHPDIAANVWRNPAENPNNNVDDDGNGFVDDVSGYDFTTCEEFGFLFCTAGKSRDNDPSDDNGHGTHLAGTIAAVKDNGIGVVGVAPSAKVMAIKGMNKQGAGVLTDVSEAIRYAVENGADVINASFGSTSDSTTLRNIIEFAHNQGVVIVAAAGNSSRDMATTYPAAWPDTIAVSATDEVDVLAPFSNFGSLLDVAAPGGGSLSTQPTSGGSACNGVRNILSLLSSVNQWDACIEVGSGYVRQAGTSMAAPHVAGVAALLLSADPSLNNEMVRTLIQVSADDVGSAGFDQDTGHGRINAKQAVTLSGLASSRPEMTVKIDVNSTDVAVGVPQPITVTVRNIGQVPASNVAVELLALGGSCDTRLLEQTVGTVSGGQEVSLNLTTSFNQVGSQILLARVDPLDSILELSETNNEYSLVLNVSTTALSAGMAETSENSLVVPFAICPPTPTPTPGPSIVGPPLPSDLDPIQVTNDPVDTPDSDVVASENTATSSGGCAAGHPSESLILLLAFLFIPRNRNRRISDL